MRALEERGRASLPELAEAAGVHPNTLRAHVLELESAGLLVSERRALPSSRGRPGIDYRLSDASCRTASKGCCRDAPGAVRRSNAASFA